MPGEQGVLRSDEQLDSLERGLDELTSDRTARRSRGRRVARRALPPLLAVGLLLAAWQGLAWARVKPDYLFPPPAAVWSTLVEQARTGVLGRAIWLSVSRGLVGFAVAVAIGTPLGLLVARVRPVGATLRPILSGLQSLPSVAWVPAAVIWFGLTSGTVYAVVLLGSVPSIAAGMASGLEQVPPLYLRVGRVLGARGLRAARFILLPAALPGYVAGLKQGWAFSWRSLMAAELITQSPGLGTGLGQLLNTGRQFNDIALVFAMIVVILLVGVAIDQCLFAPLERTVLRHRGLRRP